MEAPGGATWLRVQFPEVPASASVLLEAGVYWEYAARHDPDITPLHVELHRAGELVPQARLELLPGTEGMRRAWTHTEGGPLEVWVQSDHRESRRACFQLRTFSSEVRW